MSPMIEDSCNSVVEKWAMKEMQLNQLHEEIVTRREALLRLTGTHHHQQAGRIANLVSSGGQTLEQATVRNERLLKDIRDADRTLAEEAEIPPDIKFQTLQSNYWAMVRNMVPLWERAVQDGGGNIGEGRDAHAAPHGDLG